MWNLPNLITSIRILLTPWIVMLLLNGDCKNSLWLTLFAGSTDFFDGLAARGLSDVSRTGAYLDPIADKILLTSLYVCFGISNVAPDWLVWLVVGRDIVILAMVAGGLLFTGIRDYPPSIWGKISTALQIATVVAILSACAYPGAVSGGLQWAMIWLTAGFTAWSGLHYVGRGLTTMRSGTPSSI